MKSKRVFKRVELTRKQLRARAKRGLKHNGMWKLRRMADNTSGKWWR